MAISTIDGPNSIISEIPAGLARVADDHVIAVAGNKARVVDISSGTAMAFGTQATYDTGAEGPVAGLMNAGALRAVSVYTIGVGFPANHLKAAVLTADLTADTVSYSVATLLTDATHDPSTWNIAIGLALGCVVDTDKMFYVFVQEEPGVQSEVMGVIVSTSGGTAVAGTPSVILNTTLSATNSVVAVFPISTTAVVAVLDDGTYFIVTVSGTSLSVGSQQSTFGGVSAGSGGCALPSGVGIAPESDGSVATFSGGAYLSSGAAGQVDAQAKMAPLQTRTAVAVGPTALKRVVLNADGTFNSTTDAYTYDSSGNNQGGFAAAMQADGSELLILGRRGSAAYMTYLNDIPTADPNGVGALGYGLTRSAGGIPGAVMI
ncbi:MAG: hypothetical protein BroJett011_04080 [Chloroflexota bacterium]|nr:MAG: hypothetical protein BroJett011_04080 [Chloroflexota bacterium]